MKKRNFKGNGIRWYVFSVVALIAGIIAGSIAAGRTDGKEIIDGLLHNVTAETGQAVCFRHSVIQNLKITALFWLMGLTVIGSFFTPVLVAGRGYAVGLGVGVLIKNYGIKGLVAAAAGVLPHSILLIPAYILLSVLSTGFSGRLCAGEKNIKQVLIKYTFTVMLVFCVILIGCLVEGYVSLSLVKLTL